MHVDIAVIDDNPEMLRQFQEIIGQLQSLTYAGESVSTQVHPFLSNWPLDVRGFAQQIAKKSPGVVVVDMRLVSDDLEELDRKSTRLNSSHLVLSYAVFFL